MVHLMGELVELELDLKGGSRCERKGAGRSRARLQR